jgi:23S rRNA (cytosine1962-C5)-methyltransferase
MTAVNDRLVLADKPAGVTTHSSLNERDRANPLMEMRDGFVEHLEDRLHTRLFVGHRLDRETTGAIAFARDSETAALLHDAFASRAVKKTYLFITDRSSFQATYDVESFIERRGSEIVSLLPAGGAPDANARTTFELIRREHGFELWRARPETGKPHQIRLHAQHIGLSILGDTLHGGSWFPTLCLHSATLELSLAGEIISHHSPAPVWFENLELAKDEVLAEWLAAVDRRLRLIRSGALDAKSDDRTLRWIHSEGDPLRAEQLGSVVHLSWFGESEPDEVELERIQKLTELCGWPIWYLQNRGNRGRTPNAEKKLQGPEPIPEKWQAREGSWIFEFRSESGLSPGLFLDQRRNRAWVKDQAHGKRVLNLFCYTGGFSVAAASGGAEKVVSVDVSRSFLEWSKTNFVLNNLPLEGHEFRAMDSREYLAWAAKKKFEFDLVICDPPSFGRSSYGVFSIEKDFSRLLESLLQVTALGGSILFSSNFERWTMEDFERRARKKLTRTPSPDWDFELPARPRNMKSFIIARS